LTAQDQLVAAYHSRPASSTARRSVVIAGLGNILEWYDFIVYGFVAAHIAKHFFPAQSESTALLATFAAFGVGFLARPLGAIFFGRLADLKGRKFVLLLAMLLMAGASMLIGVAPTYGTIGISAPIIIVFARLIQGLSAGAEFGGAAAFLIEWAPESHRGFVSSFHQVGTYGGLLLGVVAVAVVSTLLTPQQMDDWGWRAPFLAGGLLAVVALYMRRNVDETPRFRQLSETRHDINAPVSPVLAPALQAIGIVTLWSVTAFAGMVYMTTYTQRYGGLTPKQSLWSTAIASVLAVLLIPVAGAISDLAGRRLLMGLSAIGFVLVPVPLYSMIVGAPSFGTILLIQIVLSVLTAMIAGVGPAAISELFPTGCRATMVGVTSAIAVTVFGGFAPFISTILIEKTGSPVAPAYYVVAVALFTGAVLLTVPETSHKRLQ
jgi:MFS transporter, MHS family, proline/betaine transporter